MERFVIYLNDKASICPRCSGLLVRSTERFGFRCHDCHMELEVVSGETLSERELVCEEVAM